MLLLQALFEVADAVFSQKKKKGGGNHMVREALKLFRSQNSSLCPGRL